MQILSLNGDDVAMFDINSCRLRGRAWLHLMKQKRESLERRRKSARREYCKSLDCVRRRRVQPPTLIEKKTYLSTRDWMQSECARNEKNIACATFYDSLWRKCEKCGAGMENSHRTGTFSSMIRKHWTGEPMASPEKSHEKPLYQACNGASSDVSTAHWPIAIWN